MRVTFLEYAWLGFTTGEYISHIDVLECDIYDWWFTERFQYATEDGNKGIEFRAEVPTSPYTHEST